MVQGHYENLLRLSSAAFLQMSEDAPTLKAFAKTHNSAGDFEALLPLLAGRPEQQMLSFAIREFQFSLFSAATGRYRHAHGSLRLFMELALSAVLFSAREIDARMWQQGRLDVSWARITCPEEGIFSKKFLATFHYEMRDEGAEYLSLSKKLYRECSEYVHGSLGSYKEEPESLKYDRSQMSKWLEAADTARLIVIFAVISRFLPYTDKASQTSVEGLAMGDFGHLPAIQAIYN